MGKPLTKDKVFRKKFVGDELTGAMNGFFNTVSMNENSLTGEIIKAIKPAKVGTDVIYLTPPDKDKRKVPLRAVYSFEKTIRLIEEFEEKGKFVKTEDVKSALELFDKEIDKRIGAWKEVHAKADTKDRKEGCETIVNVLHDVKTTVINKCFPVFKENKNVQQQKRT